MPKTVLYTVVSYPMVSVTLWRRGFYIIAFSTGGVCGECSLLDKCRSLALYGVNTYHFPRYEHVRGFSSGTACITFSLHHTQFLFHLNFSFFLNVRFSRIFTSLAGSDEAPCEKRDVMWARWCSTVCVHANFECRTYLYHCSVLKFCDTEIGVWKIC